MKKITNKKKANIYKEPDEDEWKSKPYSLCPVPDVRLQEYAEDLINWATHNDEAIKLGKWFNLRKIYSDVFYDWCKRYEPLAKAHKQAIRIIGERREEKAFYNKANAALVMSTMAHYDKDYRRSFVWKNKVAAKARALEENKNQTKVIIMERSEPSNLVPEKEENVD